MKKDTIKAFKEDEILDIEKVIKCYNAYIYKILKNSILIEDDIEEILSDVFLIFWRKYEELGDNVEIKPYLIGITRNLIKKKYVEYNSNVQNIELFEDKIFHNIDVEELVETKEKSEIMSNCLENIKDIDREVFIMFYYRQKKIKEISQILKITEAKVKIILYRTRKFIKKRLKERGYSYGK